MAESKLPEDTNPMHGSQSGATLPAHRTFLSNSGMYFYGLAAIALGIAGLVWGDFATGWQRVQPGVPGRHALALIVAVYEILAGAALLWRPAARIGALMLTLLYAIFALLWVSPILHSPLVYDGWGNFFEEFSLVVAGAVLCTSLAPPESAWAARTAQVRRLYGLSVVSFALDHLFGLSGVATWVPHWIPPGQMFWAIATTVCFFLAAASILSGIQIRLATLLLTVMIAGFEILVWLPKLFSAPHSHFTWAGNTISLAMVGAAWVIAGSVRQPRLPA